MSKKPTAEIQRQREHRFPQEDPHRSPAGCSGISAYIPTTWLKAYKTILESKGETISSDLNRHIIATVLAEDFDIWELQRDTAAGILQKNSAISKGGP